MQEIRQSAEMMLQKAEQTNITFQNDANMQLQELDELTQQLTLHIQS